MASQAHRWWILAISGDDQETIWAEQKKLAAARWVWLRRRDKTPTKKTTWERWWEQMFQDNYEDYTSRQISARTKTGRSAD